MVDVSGSRSVELDLSSTRVRVASIPDLIHLKRLAGRTIDLADIENLEEILRSRAEGSHE